VVPPFDGVARPLSQLTDSFGALCEEARRAGANVALEMIPFSGLPTLEAALAPVAAAAAPNGGLLVDIWHVVRSGADLDEVARIPGRYIVAAEINDADREPAEGLAEDSMRRRKLCGEGEFEIGRFLARMAEAGYDGPYGVEILSDELRQASLADAARRSYASARAEVDRFVVSTAS
jgi:sugar phosphate isomerase/epimerase